MKKSTIYYPAAVRDRWPGVAREWSKLYPGLFDDDDLRMVANQPRSHFAEWYAAIHLFVRDGSLCLIEKYAYANHPAKVARLERVLSAEHCAFVRGFRKRFGVQPPDLLAYWPRRRGVRFVEVKGPGDRVRPTQASSWSALESALGTEVELIEVRPAALQGAG